MLSPILKKVLFANKKALAKWESLTPIAQRDFISWIESAKQEGTRKRRLESLPSRLLSGKRRPCCYAIVPMKLYRTLASFPKAQAEWRLLTPCEKRDLNDWVGAAQGKEEEEKRVKKVCEMLAAGKRKP